MGETSHDDLDLHVLITDGGQMQPPKQEDPDEVEITREGEEEETEDTDQEGAEEADADDEAEPAETDILELELDGLYLDLLGLEVDLDEIELEITASPGEGKLLGNLLSAVSGLLDDPGMADGLGEMLPALPSLSPMQGARELASGLANWVRSIPRQVGERLVAAIPFEQLLSKFFEALVDQLAPPEDGGEEAEAEAA